MKHIYTLAIVLCLLVNATAQIPARLDSAFSSIGWRSLPDPTSTLPQVKSEMTLQPDGKILICGTTLSGFFDGQITVSRLNSDGSLDQSFGNGGIFNYPVTSGFNIAIGLELQPDGKIVTSGLYNNDTIFNETFILRLQSNGTLDSTFGTAGLSHWNISPDDERMTDMKRMSDGSFVLCGIIASSVSSDSCFVLKITPNGRLDSSFGSNGLFRYQHNGNQTNLYAVEVLPDHSVIAGGSNYNTGGVYQNVFLIKLDSTGAIFPGFGSGGTINYDLLSDYDEVHTLKLLPGGDILVSGYAYDDITNYNDEAFVIKMNASGVFISSFGTGGVAYFPTPGAPNRAYDMDVQPNGKIVLAGELFNFTTFNNDFMVVRLLANGTPDTSFNNGQAYTTLDFMDEYDEASAVLVQPNGKILVYGQAILDPVMQGLFPVVARFAGGERSTILPLNLLSFSGRASGNRIDLAWKTSNEAGIKYFTVEQSSDGVTFADLAKVPARNTTGVNQYSYTDWESLTPTAYYRLRITGNDGKITFSQIVAFPTTRNDIVVYPTVTSSTLTIQTSQQETLLLCNAAGNVVKTLSHGANNISMLPAGIYYVKAINKVIPIIKL